MGLFRNSFLLLNLIFYCSGYPLTSALPMTPGEKDEMLEGGTSAMMQDDGVDDQVN